MSKNGAAKFEVDRERHVKTSHEAGVLEHVSKVRKMLGDNPSHSIRSISTSLGINYDTVSTILHDDLGMTKMCSVNKKTKHGLLELLVVIPFHVLN